MNREDLLALIVNHAEEQGVLDDAYWALIQGMVEDELVLELDRLEMIAIYGGY